MVKAENKTEKRGFIASLLKAAIVSIIITLVLILLFALILKLTNLNEKFIMPINLVIKAISISVGTIILAKNGEGGLVKGILFGFIFTALSFVIFSLLAGSFSFNWALLLDFVFGSIVGAIVGIITVNVKK